MKKLLFLGPEVTDFLNPMAKKLKDLGYIVDVLEIRKTPRKVTHQTHAYSAVLDYQEILEKKITIGEALKYLFRIDLYRNFVKQIVLNNLAGKVRISKSFKHSLNNLHLKEIFSPIFNKYDIINFHSITPATLSLVEYVWSEKKVILSYWGSDLFQIWGWDTCRKDIIKDFYVESEAIKRADKITVHNYEMERTVIAKFGPETGDKIVRALFGMSDKVFDKIDEVRSLHPSMEFIQKYNIPLDKLKITIGYCGDPICNHLAILDGLNKIDKAIKDKIHLLIPMTYGNYEKTYLIKIKQVLDSINIKYTLFDTFLSLEELAKLRVTSDMMIMMNKSDALSVSVCESLYAENLLISAVWLPYSPLRAIKIFFYETDFNNLTETVADAVNNYDQIKHNLIHNRAKIKSLNGFSNTWKTWDYLLESLYKN